MNHTFEQLTEVIPDELKPPLDREEIPEDFPLTQAYQLQWRESGFVVFPELIFDSVINNYCNRFIADRLDKSSPVVSGKWRHNVPYMDVPEIRDICLRSELLNILKILIGYDMGLHLNLIEWTSTERDWHQDDYLNPDFINSHYAAVWFALDDIHPDSGPFQCIPGSHKWPTMRRSKVFDATPPEIKSLPNFHSDWPSLTQDFVSQACEDKIKREDGKIWEFRARKGDVLIWHGNLIHRGSAPKVRGIERRALIAHYSSLEHRHDMRIRYLYSNPDTKSYGYYFAL